MSNINESVLSEFASNCFQSDPDDAPIFVDGSRIVRANKAKGRPEAELTFSQPVLKVSPVEFLIALAQAKGQIKTEHVVKTKAKDGSVVESRSESNLAADEVSAYIAEIAEEATEAHLGKGEVLAYFWAFLVGKASSDRETEKSVSLKIQKVREELTNIVIALASQWTDETADRLGLEDKESAVLKQQNLIGTLVALNAKSAELAARKEKKSPKK